MLHACEQRLDAAQREKLRAFESALLQLNARHNLVARGEAAHLFERHIRHSLTLLARPFPSHASLVDWGTGGGLPAIPLAIALPDCHVTAVDRSQKKIWAVRRLCRVLELSNLDTYCGCAEMWPGTASHSISRAVAPLKTLWRWHVRVATEVPAAIGTAWAAGLLCLKGGRLAEEIQELQAAYCSLTVETRPLDHLGSWFREKVVVHVRNTAQYS